MRLKMLDISSSVSIKRVMSLPALALLSLFPLSLARAQTPYVTYGYDFSGAFPWVYGNFDSSSDPTLLQGFSKGVSDSGGPASGNVTVTMNGGSSAFRGPGHGRHPRGSARRLGVGVGWGAIEILLAG